MKNNSVNNQPRQFETIAGVSDQSSQYVQMKNLIGINTKVKWTIFLIFTSGLALRKKWEY